MIEVDRDFILNETFSKNNGIFFLSGGMIRKYASYKGKEITVDFAFENDLLCSKIIHEYFFGNEQVYLQAIERVSLIFIPSSLLDKLRIHYDEFLGLVEKLNASRTINSEQRAAICRLPDATERYLMFESINETPTKIPGKYVASYLAIREETLSRIKGNLKAS